MASERTQTLGLTALVTNDHGSYFMRRFAKILFVCVAMAAVVYGALAVIAPSATLRYRLTVSVEADGVNHVGSGVVEVYYCPIPQWFQNMFPLPWGHYTGDLRGYAITVDLGERGLLFIVDLPPILIDPAKPNTLLMGSRLVTLPFVAYGMDQDPIPSTLLAQARQLRRKKGPVEIIPDNLPMIVRFADITDRKSVQEVDPRDLAATYGVGVRFSGATFEFTTDPLTPMPSNWPNWLKVYDDTTYGLRAGKIAAVGANSFKGD